MRCKENEGTKKKGMCSMTHAHTVSKHLRFVPNLFTSYFYYQLILTTF